MEILYFAKRAADCADANQNIRWLTKEDYELFCEHLKLCGQRVLEKTKWEQAYNEGAVYCGMFLGGQMVSRACVEKYSQNAWEVGDVRTARPYRGQGYAHQTCSFVLRYIIEQGKTATIRTEADNGAMKKVIADLGFSVL
ncbi:MAG: GNAT family N-acetyltransferase [Clostridia bacterium]|nr:GNAT family N-acetyltransferase [Clostridia bacterium]MBR6009146.1 GNAT family N-acetyltransferase [Clostridia bacterium]